MNNKIALVLPYFGELPNYFDLWLYSAGNNDHIDFLIFTDCKIDVSYNNVFVYQMRFNQFKEYFNHIFEFSYVLDSAYKLCDYKPAYGLALKDFLSSYDFWGYCDCDVLFGNLKHFITDDILNNYDRIYTRGHLTLYRNVEEVNKLFLLDHDFQDCFSYRYVYTTSFSCAYDEWGTKYGYGLSEILKRMNFSNYDNYDFADVYPHFYKFVLDSPEKSKVEYFIYKNKCLYGYINGNLKEFAYVHLQKREMIYDKINDPTQFWIYPNTITQKKEFYRDDFKKKVAYYFRYYIRKIRIKTTKVLNGAIYNLIDRKFNRINTKGKEI